MFHLRSDDIHFVNHVEDEVEDALLLEQVLPVPQGLQELLAVLVAEIFHLNFVASFHRTSDPPLAVQSSC